jgi:hypothetical protein
MTGTWRPTLRDVFIASLIGLLAGLGGLLWLGFNGSKETILRSAENYRALAADFIGSRVTDYLSEAPEAVAHFEDQVRYGAVNVRDPDSVRMALLGVLLNNENLRIRDRTPQCGSTRRASGRSRSRARRAAVALSSGSPPTPTASSSPPRS